MKKIKQIVQLISNMGIRYISFRIWFLFQKKSGILKLKFPTHPPKKTFINLKDWKNLNLKFLFESKEKLSFTKDKSKDLEAETLKILSGKFKFFSAKEYQLGNDYNWITNPDTGYVYNINLHWSNINDFSKEAGDIKYVWEKSRFTYLNTIIRYDYHFEIDQSEFVFREIESWINSNPINQGPNYKCSQEITLRVLNWLFALNYYKNSPALTEDRFQSIIHHIYWQMKHVNANINFSRIAVRNNHAITETLGLYLIGMLMPFYTESVNWKRKGKKYLEQEIAYQIYKDGTFLQFSMNYHRVAIQLLTWAIQLNKMNDEPFSNLFYKRAKSSLNFLITCMQKDTGLLPNYGANDGALFFKFNNVKFRDFRPQLEALSLSLQLNWPFTSFEDKNWFGITNESLGEKENLSYDVQKISAFSHGGYYLINDNDSKTFIRCGNHKDRPSQADNLHIDIWVNDENILRDAGSYKYNAKEEEIRYFFGTASHNTVMLNGFDQMQKGIRFIWFYWSQAKQATLKENNNSFDFIGTIKAFEHVANGIEHTRKVTKLKNELKWEIEDTLLHQTHHPMNQIWNPSEHFLANYNIQAFDENKEMIEPIFKEGFYSGLYGVKEASVQIVFTTSSKKINTFISRK